MFTEGTYAPILGVRVYQGEEMTIDGDFLILHSRRCAGKSVDFSYGIALDFFVTGSTIITITENGQEVRRYGNQD